MAQIISIDGRESTPKLLPHNGEAGKITINYCNGEPLIICEGAITIERAVFLLEQAKFKILRGLEIGG